MIPNILIHLKLIFGRVHEWQREQEQRSLLKELRKVHRDSFRQHILSHLSQFFMSPGTSKQQCNTAIPLEAVVSDEERLTQVGFAAEEIVALYRLRQWYQMDGREDFVMMRHWEFLKLLVNNGKLEV